MLTPIFKVNYPNLFKPRLNTQSNREEYSIVALFPKGCDLTELQNAVKAEVEANWGADKSKWPMKKNEEGKTVLALKMPFKKQEHQTRDDGTLKPGYEEGAFFVNLKSRNKPGVFDGQKTPITDEKAIYSGCYGRAAVNVKAYSNDANKGVAIYINGFQKTADGERIGGSGDASSEFSIVETADEPKSVAAQELGF